MRSDRRQGRPPPGSGGTDLRSGSQAIRDGVLRSGMESGVERSYERLEEMLPSLLELKR